MPQQRWLDSLETELRERLNDARKDLATKSDLTELKYDLLKWIIGLAMAQSAVLVGVLLRLPH
jgi:hypothetical protein